MVLMVKDIHIGKNVYNFFIECIDIDVGMPLKTLLLYQHILSMESKVKRERLSTLIHQYKLFRMINSETILDFAKALKTIDLTTLFRKLRGHKMRKRRALL
ncbi:hypothetical protein CR513_41992, partial [Mucuna pruriens]